MTRFYLISSIAICALFAYLSVTGGQLFAEGIAGHSKPTGAGHYHK